MLCLAALNASVNTWAAKLPNGYGHACIRVSCIHAAVCASAVMASGLMGVGFMVLFQWVSEKVYALTGSASEPVVVYSLASALASSMCMARA